MALHIDSDGAAEELYQVAALLCRNTSQIIYNRTLFSTTACTSDENAPVTKTFMLLLHRNCLLKNTAELQDEGLPSHFGLVAGRERP